MQLRRALLIAACVFAAWPALAQFPPAPQQQPAGPSPWDQAPQPQQQAAPAWPSQQQQQQPQQSPWSQQPPPGQQAQEECAKNFGRLRDDAQKKATAIQNASKNKVGPKVACGLFNAFSAAELRMIKYAQENTAKCGVPPNAVDQMKKQHATTDDIRGKVCQAAAQQPAGPVAPSLSDALTAPIANSENIKTGRGTFDTLTGTPLGPK